MSEGFGVLAPHPPIMVDVVGRDRAAVTSASAEALARAARALADYAPQTVVVISPHAPGAFDAIAVDDSAHFSGSFQQFGAAQPVWRYRGDPSLAEAIIGELDMAGIPAVSRSAIPQLDHGALDHGALVPLSFLDPDGDYALVVVSYSGLDYRTYADVGAAIARAAGLLERKIAFVASGDLSHRLTRDAPAGYSPRAADLDQQIVAHVSDGRLAELAGLPVDLLDAGGECGVRAFVAMSGFLGDDPAPTHLLSYEGPWGVGYLVALAGADALRADAAASTPGAGSKGGMPGSDDSEIVMLARRAIEAYLTGGGELDAPELRDRSLPEQAGCFVSLHRGGDLRGCIGTILPTRGTLAEEVVHNAIQASTRDPRFPRMQPAELVDLDVKVDVLRAPEACTLEELDPKQYGVIVTSGWRRGLLLPDLDGVDDVMTQVDIAMRKGGILPHEPCHFERFKVDRYT